MTIKVIEPFRLSIEYNMHAYSTALATKVFIKHFYFQVDHRNSQINIQDVRRFRRTQLEGRGCAEVPRLCNPSGVYKCRLPDGTIRLQAQT